MDQPEGKSGFIDLVLKHNEYSTFRLIIECKRVKADDARQLRWLFLVENAKSDFVERASSFEAESDIGARVWDVSVAPLSLQSEFCVLPGDEPRRPLLEAVAKELLEATEGLAQGEIAIAQSIQESQRRLYVRLFLFPMIVTNAKIAVCRFDPDRVDLERGCLWPL